MGKNVVVDVKDGVAVLTLDRPEKLNAWDGPMRAEVQGALVSLQGDEGVGAIIITGAGANAFSAGQDLAETRKFGSGEDGVEWSKGWRAFYETIRGVEKPLVAALNGVAAGSAFQVAMMADVRVGHEGVRMGQPEINSGIPSTMGPWLMIERLGLSRTTELTLSGRMMEARECHAIGLIHHLVPRDEVMAKSREVARELAAKPPLAMRLTKRRFREITQPAFEEACRVGEVTQRQAYDSGEPQAYMAKFFAERAKRKDST